MCIMYEVVLECDDKSKVIGTYNTHRKASEVYDLVDKVRPEFGSVYIRERRVEDDC